MSTSPAAISKREQKRQAKLAKELAEKSQAEDASSPVESKLEILPIVDQDTNGQTEASAEQRPSPFIEPVQKRIRNYLKKKQKLDQLTERANDPAEHKKLNKDQLEQLARKDQVLAPLKELQNLAEQFNEIHDEHNRALSSEADETTKGHAAAVSAAKEEGLKEGKKILSSLISFLGYASVLRANPTPDKAFNDANERLLSIVYLGGDASIEAASNLDAGTDDMVDDTSISFKRIHDAIFSSAEASPEDGAADDPEVHAEEDSKTTNGQYSGSNFVSLSELSQKPSTIGSGGISFLNESEIEGTSMPESLGVPAATEQDIAPGQTIADNDGNKASAALDWASIDTPRTNWADEVETGTSELNDVAAPPEAAPERGGLQPLSEFKTIQKKTQNRDAGRGRGERGGARGRGDKGSRGRGRGSNPKPQT